VNPSPVFTLEDLETGEGFSPFRPGVEIRVLYGTPGLGAAAAILRYRPGAGIPAHEHPGYELVYVLSGAQSDERGTYRAGTFVLNEPGSRHAVESSEGCLVLVMWERPVVFMGDA
jgi:anti-sigma factor ChrR (cupin superfamily)